MYVYGKKRCRIDVESIGTASSSFYIQSVVSVLRQSGGRRKKEKREREREREDDVFLHGLFRKKKRDGSVDRYVCMESGRKERERERESSRLRRMQRGNEREKEKEKEREAVTDQLPRNTNSCRCSTKWRPPLLNLFTPTSTPNYPLLHPAPVFPIVLFDTRPPAPIDLGSLKTRWKPPTTAFAGAA